MKRFLVPTDFSQTANHAAAYAWKLAVKLKAELILCNAVILPAEVPMASAMMWPADESDSLLENSTLELDKLKASLVAAAAPSGFKPEVLTMNEAGPLSVITDEIVRNQHIQLVIIGSHGTSGLNEFFLGDHSRDFINQCRVPLLIVPAGTALKPVKKIAFAGNIRNPKIDLQAINELIDFARPLRAEIMLTYVSDKNPETPEFEAWIGDFIALLRKNTGYSAVFYRIVLNKQFATGFDWLCEHGEIDMLAMVHRNQGFIGTLFKGNQTQKMARHISVPLLVFPEKE